MSLIVFTRCRISPETDTPITFWVKSPRATAVYKVLSSPGASRMKQYTYCGHGDSSDLYSQLFSLIRTTKGKEIGGAGRAQLTLAAMTFTQSVKS
jgi:hypothetical protein